MRTFRIAMLVAVLALAGCTPESEPAAEQASEQQAFALTPSVIAMRWQWLNPEINSFTFREAKEVFEFRDVRRGGEVWELPRADGFAMPDGYPEFAEDTFTNAMLVLKDGRIVFEDYRNRMTPETRHTAFSMSKTPLAVDGGGGAGYTDVMSGYLYYAVPADTSAAIVQRNKIITNEWMDLSAVAGTNEVIGFAGRRGPLGRVRPANEAPREPDTYPLQNTGVIRMRDNMWARATWYSDMAAALRTAAAR